MAPFRNKVGGVTVLVLSQHHFRTKIYNGTKSHKNVSRVMVLVICTSSDDVLYLSQVSQKYLKGFLSYLLDTISMLEFMKGALFHKNAGGVTILILCTSSDDALYLYHVS